MIDGVYLGMSDERLREEIEERLEVIRRKNDEINVLAAELHELRREDRRRALARGATEAVTNG